MSIFHCHECDRPRNRKLDGFEQWNGEPVCEDCFTELDKCDHAFELKPDTQGDGRDCSYYECAMPGCDRKFYADDIPDDIRDDRVFNRLLNGGF